MSKRAVSTSPDTAPPFKPRPRLAMFLIAALIVWIILLLVMYFTVVR